MEYHIGIDSTDSAELGMCTTYLGAVLLERLTSLPIKLSSFPGLIRLNPNVPWKTRGNGAISFNYTGQDGLEKAIFEVCADTVEEMSVKEDPQTNPGLVLIKGELDKDLNRFYHDALHRIVDMEEARKMANRSRAMIRTWKNGRGLIGALAAIGANLDEFTYEAILYRPGSVKDRKRDVDHDSLRMLSERYPTTFFNVNEKGEVLCIPHSPCPVIFGIRGTDPTEAREMMLKSVAKGGERWVLWRTNQHTNSHIEGKKDLKDIISFSSISTEVVVSSEPAYSDGGHLSFEIEDIGGINIRSWAYEPTKSFRKDLSGLKEGDRIRVWGSIREKDEGHDIGINLERVDILELVEVLEEFNPRCPDCGGPTESMGKGQALRCKKCGKREGISKEKRIVERDLKIRTIEPPKVAWRHLYKPKDLIPATEIIEGPPYFGVL